MNLAVSVWRGRVAPLFDVSRCIALLSMADGRLTERRQVTLDEMDPWERIPRLKSMGVDLLICGAMSRPLQLQAEATGIRVVSFVAGEVDHVIDAWQRGCLERDDYRMPGCGMRRRQRRGRGRWRS